MSLFPPNPPTAAQIPADPFGAITGTNVQAQLQEIAALVPGGIVTGAVGAPVNINTATGTATATVVVPGGHLWLAHFRVSISLAGALPLGPGPRVWALFGPDHYHAVCWD